MRIAFVHNRLPDYRIPVFEEFAKFHDVQFIITESPPESNSLRNTVYLSPFHVPKIDYEIVPGLINALNEAKPELIVTTDATYYISHAVNFFHHKHGIPYVLWLEQWSPNFHPRHVMMKSIERKTIRDAAVVFALGTKARDYALKMGASPVNVVRAFNTCPPLHISDLDVIQGNRAIEDRLRILFIGRVEKIKGLQTVLKALDMLDRRKFEVIIGGTGKYSSQLRQAISKAHLDSVEFLDHYITRDKQVSLLTQCDVFILPSERWWAVEAWGLVLNEALSLGKYIVVSSQAGAAYDLISDEEDGQIFQAKDPVSLANVLQNTYGVLSRGNNEFERRERYFRKFSMQQITDGLRVAVERAKEKKIFNGTL